ncbi:PITH domain-containing protein [Mycena indigotica]|uniref:PITH domain-containing protein n=1 Tax=Mycena indigotica TaxID=2126181 RepID=A0A8H6S9A6_9AGAR|nr:PITH domain-containing protein [Mycena indigotica]KAF7295204.1 PITH domain-containing protein [Mycena indigotica]
MSTEDVSLLQFIDLSQLHCLNESTKHTFASIVSSKALNSSSNYLESDEGDPELLLNIQFHQTVRVRSIVFKATGEQAPKKVKLLVNRMAVGFEDVAEDASAAQILELSADDVANGRPTTLRFVRFQSVNSIHIFIASNQGDADETRLDGLDILGVPVETTKDLSGLKKQEEH